MKATYDSTTKTKWTQSHRKEGKCLFDSYSVIDLSNPAPWGRNKLNSKIELRLYGTGNQNFACLWVWGQEINTQGSGRAGGYGYHRPSAAAQEAISNAGFTLSQDIGGVGHEAIHEALCAIAEAIGLTNYGVLHAHP
jgi:hypothetical protein